MESFWDAVVILYLAIITVFVLNSTAIGIRCKDGIVFGVEKLVLSKLYEQGSNKRIFNIDRHVGMVRTYQCQSLP